MPEALCPACLAQAVLAGPQDASAPPGNSPNKPLTGLRFFGDYELLEEIGRGGTGVVFKAQQLGVKRVVALKVLTGGAAAGREFVNRFHMEAATAASLSHPNIVPIYEFGEHEGTHYLAMRFMERGTLQTARSSPFDSEGVARLLVTIASAVQYAHQHGVLHRDLKPANILIDTDGQPQVADFGLARALEGDSTLTLSGVVLGTAPYLAPEVAARGAGAATTASDVYGLGAILYHQLTGRPPFLADTFEATLRQVLQSEPIPPGQSNPDVAADLQTICLKCLDKETAKRYATVQELADDLSRFLRDEPINARPVTRVEQIWRWCRRKPIVAGLVLGLNLVFALGLAGVLWEWRRAVLSELSARQHRYVSDMNLVQRVWDEGNVQQAKRLLLAHVPKSGEPDLRGFEWRYLWTLCGREDTRYTFTNFEHSIGDLACSAGGKVLAVAAGHKVRLLDILLRKELGELNDPDPNEIIYRVAWSPLATNILATAGGAGAIKLWNLATRQVSVLSRYSSAKGAAQIFSIAFSPDGRLLAVALSPEVGNGLRLWDVDLRKELWATNTVNPTIAVAFTKDSRALISTGGESGNAMVWEAASGKALTPFPALHTAFIRSIVLSPDGMTVATASADNRIILWDLATRRAKATLASPAVDVVAFSPDGRLIASSGDDGLVRVWDTGTGTQLALFRGHSGPIGALAFTSDGKEIVSGGADGTVRIWDPKASGNKGTVLKQDQSANCLTFTPNGKRLAVASYFRDRVEVWEVPSGRWLTNLSGHSHDAWSAAFSPDGKFLAVGSSDATIRLFHADTLELADVLTNPIAAGPFAFSPDSKVLAVTSFTESPPDGAKRLTFWDIPSRKRIERLADAAPDAASVAFSSDRRFLAIGYLDGSVRLWNFQTGRKIAEFKNGSSTVWSVAFSPDDALVAAMAGEKVLVYTVATRQISGELPGHMGGGWMVAFAPDGKTLASAGNDGTVKLWNLATLELVLALKQDVGPVYGIAFTKDGSLLASGGANGEVHFWPAASREPTRLDTSIKH